MNEDKTPRAKNLMYAQQLQHLPKGIETAEDLASLIENKLNPVRYAVIIHDQETDDQGQPKEPDIHAMMSFENARYCSSVAKKLGDKPQYVQAWSGEANNGYAYLVHETAKARKEGKHQYDPAGVKANFDFPALIEKIKAEVVQAKAARQVEVNAKTMLDLLFTGAVTKADLEKQLTGSQYAKYHRQIEDVDAKRLVKEAAKWRAEMKAKNAQIQVIWIYGPSGSGKTSLAKEYAQKRGQPYFISGSTRDVFQGYNGEHTMILDELRPGVLTYADLLRITDPHGIDNQVMAPCRYNDKALACDLIIITTPYTPVEFYDKLFPLKTMTPNLNQVDGVDQLVRRISLTVEMIGRRIQAMQYVPFYLCPATGSYCPIPGTERPNPYSCLARPTPPNQAEDIYNSMFED